MTYRYAVERTDHSALASGHVLRSAPGFPGFPVRLADELFQRAAVHTGLPAVRLWDPCCGSGYLATVLGLLHRERIASVRATDVDPDAVELAGRNLRLLTAEGLAEREEELRRSARDFGRPSFVERAEDARGLARGLARAGGDLPHEAAVADVFSDPGPVAADLVVTDVPYGEMTAWAGEAPGEDPVGALLASLGRALPPGAVIVVTARTRRVPLPEGVRALERVRVGVRAAVLVRARDVA
ncbi:rRNA methyltransferase [Nocardiopsis changdeensis]|uniref:rRNA methyltransferase n=1 Tax=Nocardiopsis changdeensis TaxID=2831969 RepID=A0ABX8BMV7_9ACTN|nr:MULTISPECIES: rRNA methyltransferase [Nocardiopsis]QUX22387.1 rRNA methyltransferase [Nocardiopsis changdeensis]QYX38329.1 rRNA methyltransferase [Nocardiopsis sp. MT53]